MVIPPKYAVSDIVGTMTANTSREIRKRFPWIRRIYWRTHCGPSVFLLHGRGQRRRHQKICGVSGASRHGQTPTGFRVLVPKCHGRKPVGIYSTRGRRSTKNKKSCWSCIACSLPRYRASPLNGASSGTAGTVGTARSNCIQRSRTLITLSERCRPCAVPRQARGWSSTITARSASSASGATARL